MKRKKNPCPDCAENSQENWDRRDFLRAMGAATAATALPAWASPGAQAAPTPTSPAETAVKALYDSLSGEQKKEICFPWDHRDPKRGLLRTFISNNWQITPHAIRSPFFTPKQQGIIHDIFKGVIHPDWHARVMKQLRDDTGGNEWGAEQSIAIFGTPGSIPFEFVMTGRHMTIRADGNTEDHVAFGGPIFYGHAASGFREKVHHPGNVFWYQAEMANKVYQMLDGRQRQKALLDQLPRESAVAFRKALRQLPGIPVADLTADQKEELKKVLLALVAHYRKEDQEESLACLAKQGGLDRCCLAFYKQGDIGDDGEWDNWRLEGPAFVWYFRGFPHVHVWVNVADDPAVALNAQG